MSPEVSGFPPFLDQFLEVHNLMLVQSAFNLGEDDNGEYTELRKEAVMQLQSIGDASPSLFLRWLRKKCIERRT